MQIAQEVTENPYHVENVCVALGGGHEKGNATCANGTGGGWNPLPCERKLCEDLQKSPGLKKHPIILGGSRPQTP